MSSERPAVSSQALSPQPLSPEERAGHVAVERAMAELRSGRAVLLEHGEARALVLGAEAIDTESAARLAAVAPLRARLALPAPRLTHLGLPRTQPGTIALPGIAPARVETLALQVDARIDAPVSGAEPLDAGALELLRLALVLPAAVVAPVETGTPPSDALRVSLCDVLAHRGRQARSLRIVGRAPVPLDGAPKTEFVVFRGGEGLRDQVAVVVGTPDLSRPVPVRLHSACLTGDLFGSLKCDCGDQLRDTVARMAAGAGGILLYLDQEGRGNGIANKMRAYKLQSEGMDTYDADEVLGFGLDQRRFDFAAQMLRMLGVEKVELHTNNPEKIAALKAAGLTVAAEARVLGRPTQENVRYLAAKRDRAGHHIDFDALAARISE
ncbi:GTP cyclohydrolase II RibA [Aquabacter cavernae]|uniref:GTP cyclohydrolase II RibA n=1 Tax=Aquabacter cavernae TaxID=2496029 RepID=UPI000F8DAF75|nr:GTP cyclohydrolase II RibA [Aquabacter cavernae]